MRYAWSRFNLSTTNHSQESAKTIVVTYIKSDAETPLVETGERRDEARRFFGFWRDKISGENYSAPKFSDHSSGGESIGVPAAESHDQVSSLYLEATVREL